MHTVGDTDQQLSLDHWTQRFYVFVAVILEKNPEHGPALMKYGYTIREMAHQGVDWRMYDQDFRQFHSGLATIPWDQLNSELFLLARDTHNLRYKRDSELSRFRDRSPKRRQSFPQGACWTALSNNGACHKYQCSFRHSCNQCKGNHPTNRCARKPAHKSTDSHQGRRAGQHA